MTLREFIRQNRADVDAHINHLRSRPNSQGWAVLRTDLPRLNDAEREGWVQNDEGLYRWWRASR